MSSIWNSIVEGAKDVAFINGVKAAGYMHGYAIFAIALEIFTTGSSTFANVGKFAVKTCKTAAKNIGQTVRRFSEAGGIKGVVRDFNDDAAKIVSTEGKLVKNHMYNLNSKFEVVNSSEPQLLIPAGKKMLYGDLNMPLNFNNKVSGLGKIMYDDALIYFVRNQNIDGVYGHWLKNPQLYANYGGESINLTKFKSALLKGMNAESAAFETITGE